MSPLKRKNGKWGHALLSLSLMHPFIHKILDYNRYIVKKKIVSRQTTAHELKKKKIIRKKANRDFVQVSFIPSGELKKNELRPPDDSYTMYCTITAYLNGS
jgi:hypothetical protein